MLSAHSDNKGDLYEEYRHILGNVINFGDNKVNGINVYKHLGGMTAFDGAMSPEAKQRTSAHRRALGPLRKVVHRRINTKVETKMVLTDALATSTLFYNAHTWTPLTNQDKNLLTSSLVAGYRSAARLQLRGPLCYPGSFPGNRGGRVGGHQATSPSSSLGHRATLPTSSLGHQATSLASS